MKRRGFLKNLGSGAGSLLLSNWLGDVEPVGRAFLNRLTGTAGGDDFWRTVRAEFRMNPGVIHLNSGTLGATPRMVLDAVSGYRRQIEGNPAVNNFGWGGGQLEQFRAHAAGFLGAEAEEIVLTRNTTEGMNTVAVGLDLQPGDRILTTNHEHGGGMVCWQHLRRHRGVVIDYVDMPRPVQSKSELVDLIRAKITPRTRVCSLSDVDTITGVRMPLAEIASITRPRGILLVCDGAQAAGMVDVDVRKLGVDTYAYSGHKWLLGPKGSGLLYIRKEIQDRIQPVLLHSGYSGYSASSGTRDVAKVLGHMMTLEFLETIGTERIEARCRELRAYLEAQLSEIPGLTPLTPGDPELSGAIQTWSLDRGSSGAVIGRLRDEHDVVLKSVQRTYSYSEEDWVEQHNYNAIRFSTHIFNSEAQLDQAVDRLRTVLAEA
jgi:isopenicillin-N epimerase